MSFNRLNDDNYIKSILGQIYPKNIIGDMEISYEVFKNYCHPVTLASLLLASKLSVLAISYIYAVPTEYILKYMREFNLNFKLNDLFKTEKENLQSMNDRSYLRGYTAVLVENKHDLELIHNYSFEVQKHFIDMNGGIYVLELDSQVYQTNVNPAYRSQVKLNLEKIVAQINRHKSRRS